MLLSFFGSFIANMFVIILLAFVVYYAYNKKAGSIKDIKEGISKFVSEIKEIPSKVSDLLKKLDDLKKKLDAISKMQ